MDEFDFTDDEIRDQLESLGYFNIPKERLQQFKHDLEHLVHYERSRSNSSLSTNSHGGIDDSNESHLHNEQLRSNKYLHTAVTKGLSARENAKHEVDRPASSNLTDSNDESLLPPRIENIVYPRPNISLYKPSVSLDEGRAEISSYPRRQENVSLRPNYSAQAKGSSLSGKREDVVLPREVNGDHQGDALLDKKIVKRKTLRKRDGQTVVDESFTESEQDDTLSLEERMRYMHMAGRSDGLKRPQSAPPGGAHLCSRPHSSRDAAPSRVSDDFGCPMSGLIHPMTDHPHTRNLRRDDPVDRYRRYAQVWKSQQAPGEKDHRNLRWNVREHLTNRQSEPKKAHRFYIPNNYVIPGEKKRTALRWQIREDLAQGFVPTSVYD